MDPSEYYVVRRGEHHDMCAEIERLRAEVRESARRNVTLFGELQTAVEEINRLRSAVELSDANRTKTELFTDPN